MSESTPEISVAEEIQTFLRKLIEHAGWELEVDIGEKDDETVYLELDGEDRDDILQNRAEVMEALQYLLNRMYGRRLETKRVLVDCGGFRKRKEAELREIAKRISDRVRMTGNEESLGLMNAYERRIVHLAVAETDGVSTMSSGDGLMKRVVIRPA